MTTVLPILIRLMPVFGFRFFHWLPVRTDWIKGHLPDTDPKVSVSDVMLYEKTVKVSAEGQKLLRNGLLFKKIKLNESFPFCHHKAFAVSLLLLDAFQTISPPSLKSIIRVSIPCERKAAAVLPTDSHDVFINDCAGAVMKNKTIQTDRRAALK